MVRNVLGSLSCCFASGLKKTVALKDRRYQQRDKYILGYCIRLPEESEISFSIRGSRPF